MRLCAQVKGRGWEGRAQGADCLHAGAASLHGQLQGTMLRFLHGIGMDGVEGARRVARMKQQHAARQGTHHPNHAPCHAPHW